MRVLRWILFILVAAIVVAVAYAYMLPREISVARSTDIAAPPAVVYPMIADLRQFQSWSPWADIDPDAEVSFSGPSEGVGQSMTWSSDNPEVGSGTMTISAVEPDSRVEVALDFGDQGDGVSWFDIVEAGDGSKVTWGFQTDLGMNPIARYFGMMIDGMVADSYDKGLARLKELSEAEQAAAEEAERMAREEAMKAEEAARQAAEEAARAAEEAAKAAADAATNAAGDAMPGAADATSGAPDAMTGPTEPMAPTTPEAPANPPANP